MNSPLATGTPPLFALLHAPGALASFLYAGCLLSLLPILRDLQSRAISDTTVGPFCLPLTAYACGFAVTIAFQLAVPLTVRFGDSLLTGRDAARAAIFASLLAPFPYLILAGEVVVPHGAVATAARAAARIWPADRDDPPP